MRSLPLCLLLCLMLVIAACDDQQTARAPRPDGNVTPTMVTDSVNTFVSDSGITRYQLIAPLWLMFDDADEPYWLFPQGLEIRRFDDHMQPNLLGRADTARFYSRLNLWQFDHNVRMKTLNGDRVDTHQLFWDQNAHTVYSDSFIHMERHDRILEGFGFRSNETFTTYTLRHPTGTVPQTSITTSSQQ